MAGGLSRNHILRGRKHFDLVREQGSREQSFLLSLGFLPVEKGLGLKIGFVTPKHLGLAHERNCLRRRLKEIVLHSPVALDAPFWLVLVARHPARKADFHELANHWHRLAMRVSLPGFSSLKSHK